MNTTFTYTTRIKIAVLHHLHQFNESVHTNAMEAFYTADRQLPNFFFKLSFPHYIKNASIGAALYKRLHVLLHKSILS
jgi:hypothetical protein